MTPAMSLVATVRPEYYEVREKQGTCVYAKGTPLAPTTDCAGIYEYISPESAGVIGWLDAQAGVASYVGVS